jgi:aldehyde:ferredoxin oxidoreductase
MQPILTVNLTTGESDTFKVPLDWEIGYIGGASLATRILYDFLSPEQNPLSPEAPLLFLNGPLSGTAGPAVGRFVICAKSPATGLWGESNCGGFWGPELRKTGHDGILVTGKAARPVFLLIQDNDVQILPADDIWGLETYASQAVVKNKLNTTHQAFNGSVAVIGPAGEKMIPYALIMTDHGRVAGRTGMGAVMGSKNLKAVAVKGTGKIPVADEKLFHPLRSAANRSLRDEVFATVARDLGTTGVTDLFDYLGLMPKKYYSERFFDGLPNISGSLIAEKYKVGISACHACVIACGRIVQLAPDEPRRKGVEYETLAGFGPNLLIDDPVFITRMGELCDRFGMDTISLSNTIGLAFKLFEQKIISKKDTGGLNLHWGNQQAVEALIHQTVNQEDLGKWIAQGSRELGQHFGAEEEAVQVNGLEVAYHDPRGSSGMALVYATSPRGACHNQSDYYFVDVGQVESSLGMTAHDRHAGAEKAANVAIHQNWRSAMNSLVICNFANLEPEIIAQLVSAACGRTYSVKDLLLSGERAFNLKRMLNYHLGLRKENDALPKPLLIPLNGDDTRVPDIDEMLSAYYTARDWDAQSGQPTDSKQIILGVDQLFRR